MARSVCQASLRPRLLPAQALAMLPQCCLHRRSLRQPLLVRAEFYKCFKNCLFSCVCVVMDWPEFPRMLVSWVSQRLRCAVPARCCAAFVLVCTAATAYCMYIFMAFDSIYRYWCEHTSVQFRHRRVSCTAFLHAHVCLCFSCSCRSCATAPTCS